MKTLVILQARMSSSRLPGKVMAQVNGKPMIYWLIQRINQCPAVDKLVVATSVDISDNVLSDYLYLSKVEHTRGSLLDVHSRFQEIIERYTDYTCIVRLTADCPLVMPNLLELMMEEFSSGQYDYYSNFDPPTYPDGLDIEVFSREAFQRMSELELSSEDKEHVTLRFRSEPQLFNLGNKLNSSNESFRRWTVDFQEDLDFIRRIFSNFVGFEARFDFPEILELLRINPSIENKLTGNLRNIALTNRSEKHFE